jgi:hypothetical protein
MLGSFRYQYGFIRDLFALAKTQQDCIRRDCCLAKIDRYTYMNIVKTQQASDISDVKAMDSEPEQSRGRKRQREEDVSVIASDQEQKMEQMEQPQRCQRDRIPTQTTISGSNRRPRRGEGGDKKNSIHFSVKGFPFGLSSRNQSRPQPTRPSVSMRRSRINPQNRGRYDFAALETATPSIRQSFGSSLASVPEAVDRLVDFLAQDAGSALPSSMRGFFGENSPRLAQQTSESAFTADEQL